MCICPGGPGVPVHLTVNKKKKNYARSRKTGKPNNLNILGNQKTKLYARLK